ncbi:MAG: hypothetical protein IPP90_07620 [Gemmatimonadaceae bacterium]|nr:hypothetical protein [Gemmatimonadaceae bacterium]
MNPHRPALRTLVAATLLPAAIGLSPQRDIAQPSHAYLNGQWFDGVGFRRGDRYVVDGLFTSQRPARLDQTTDLDGAFVVPPYGEAHSHNVESSRFDAVSRMHLARGVFYVKNPNALKRYTTPLMGRINVPGALDATFALGGLTSSGGHPVEIAARQIARGAWTAADGDGGFYWVIDDLNALAARWSSILAEKPDFIKTYLLYSEEYNRRRNDSTYRSWRGLDPAVLPQIVKRAHAAGLRVSTHIESAHDFRIALAAGVDEINHLPGFRPDRDDPRGYEDLARYMLADEDARRAARAGVVVVTTLGGILEMLDRVPASSEQAPLASRTRDMLRENLRRLHRHGVRVALEATSMSALPISRPRTWQPLARLTT